MTNDVQNKTTVENTIKMYRLDTIKGECGAQKEINLKYLDSHRNYVFTVLVDPPKTNTRNVLSPPYSQPVL